MEWEKLRYTRSQVDKAGITLIKEKNNIEEIEKAYEILGNWRAIHSFPLHIIKKNLNLVSKKIDRNAIVVQRLKRTISIRKKLFRFKTMKLTQIQDIGGCRAVLNDVKLVKQLHNKYIKNDKKNNNHELTDWDDYIENPKHDGYRGIHLIYKYKGEDNKDYDNLKIEIQIRSKIQHLWATAVETVDHITKKPIKSNEGDEKWSCFFKLMGTVFANIECTPKVSETPDNKLELYNEIKKISQEIGVIEKLEHWRSMLHIMEDFGQKKGFYLLNLELKTGNLIISHFSSIHRDLAEQEYIEAEKRMKINNENKDIVLVETNSFKDLKKAYPNYFNDTQEFIKMLKDYLNKLPNN